MSSPTTPLEAAEIVLRSSSRDLPRDPATGLWIADGTEPPTELTTPLYDAALKVLELRDRAARR